MKIVKYILVSVFSMSIVFHLLVVFGIIDYHMVWGGRLNNKTEMIRFESVSLLLNAFFLFIILVKTQVIHLKCPQKLLTVILWMMIVLFALNTLGNLMSTNFYEKLIFTPLTLLNAILLFLVVRDKNL